MSARAAELALPVNASPVSLHRPPPFGRRVELGSRGTTFYREVSGPEGAPTLLLLHGWVASGGMNWAQAFEPLGRHFRVIAPDLRGHGRGIRSPRRFRLRDCADDMAALLEHLDTGPVIVVGYSMGGLVAQLLWRRHRERVVGLALVARTLDRLVFGSAMVAASEAARAVGRSVQPPLAWLRQVLPRPSTEVRRPRSLRTWLAAEMGRHDWRMLLEAGAEVARHDARPWLREIDVPTAVLITTEDAALGTETQYWMAHQISGATIHCHEDGHTACAWPAFGRSLLGACQDVAERIA
ncbi:MAG: alpha/beta hydrolase [Proteobacteria bacterium]|nr:alpha/beta hydrolase [Pseudomonadota bacterium]